MLTFKEMRDIFTFIRKTKLIDELRMGTALKQYHYIGSYLVHELGGSVIVDTNKFRKELQGKSLISEVKKDGKLLVKLIDASHI